MSHRAAFYHVRVRPHRDRDNWQLLGDYDGAGTWVGQVIGAELRRLHGQNRDGKVQAFFERDLPGIGGDQVGVAVTSGRKGVVAVIRKEGEPDFDQTAEHSANMRSVLLFDLPRTRNTGRLAIHVPHGRSCKGIVENALRDRFSQDRVLIELAPIVPMSALAEAIKRDQIERITLIKHDPTRADKFQDAAQWGTDVVDQVALTIPAKRRRRLRGDPVRRFLDDRSDENRRQIVEFAGLEFDEATVTVELEDGATRTFHLEGREGGHPMTLGIDVHGGDRFGPEAADLGRELARALTSV